MSTLDGKAQEAKAQAEKARDQLADTLDAIEDKLNVPKRLGELKNRATASYDQNRTPWLIGGASVAAVVIGLVAWAIFGDD
jgi:ElaB/YqjD/DUF883 family membrane-anchored ribosome-binding protein